MDEFIEKISKKFDYPEELKTAIKISMALMLDEYGQEHYASLCSLFEDVRIFVTNDMSWQNLQKIQQFKSK